MPAGPLPDCRAQFIKIYDVDPDFDLTPAEAGHPSWTKTFAGAKAQAQRREADKAKEGQEKGAMITDLGRYKIVAEIGQGAMGTVYKAVDPIIDRTVAIKTINLNLSKQELEEYEARFQQEIKAAGRLNHPNIVTVYDVGKTDQVAYMAMEFLEGAGAQGHHRLRQAPAHRRRWSTSSRRSPTGSGSRTSRTSCTAT